MSTPFNTHVKVTPREAVRLSPTHRPKRTLRPSAFTRFITCELPIKVVLMSRDALNDTLIVYIFNLFFFKCLVLSARGAFFYF